LGNTATVNVYVHNVGVCVTVTIHVNVRVWSIWLSFDLSVAVDEFNVNVLKIFFVEILHCSSIADLTTEF
jgi:hypothetical protein